VVASFDHSKSSLLGRSEQLDMLGGHLGAERRVIGPLHATTR
jgi:hypothetical protein